MDTKSHPKCWGQDGHVCQEPSGRACIDCGEPAGTSWGPLWCPDCDVKRLDKISASLESIAADHLRNAALSEKGANTWRQWRSPWSLRFRLSAGTVNAASGGRTN